MTCRIYLRADLHARGIKYSDMHLRRLEKAGVFPKRFKLNPSSDAKQARVGWDGNAVDAYIEQLAASSQAAQ